MTKKSLITRRAAAEAATRVSLVAALERRKAQDRLDEGAEEVVGAPERRPAAMMRAESVVAKRAAPQGSVADREREGRREVRAGKNATWEQVSVYLRREELLMLRRLALARLGPEEYGTRGLVASLVREAVRGYDFKRRVPLPPEEAQAPARRKVTFNLARADVRRLRTVWDERYARGEMRREISLSLLIREAIRSYDWRGGGESDAAEGQRADSEESSGLPSADA